MSDSCIICECEAVDTADWYYCEKTCEYICPWCVKEMYNIKQEREAELDNYRKNMTNEEKIKINMELLKYPIQTGTPRPAVYCKICKKSYIDFCMKHHNIPNSWELKSFG